MTDWGRRVEGDDGWIVDTWGNRHETGFRQLRSLLVRTGVYFSKSELPIKRVKKGMPLKLCMV